MASITLKKRLSRNESSNMTRLRVWVSETSDNIPSEIFLHRILPEIPELGYTKDYVQVCSYAHMNLYPTESETMRDAYSHVRTSWMDILFPSGETAEATWTAVQTAVTALLNDIAAVHSNSGVEYTVEYS